MSLLKARELKLGDNLFTYEFLEDTFKAVLDGITEQSIRSDLRYLLGIYANYSALYLREVSLTLVEPPRVNQTMKFMNSYIAEVCHKAEVPYYHKEEGYTIIDKVLGLIFDSGTSINNYDVIEPIIEAMLVVAEEETTEE